MCRYRLATLTMLYAELSWKYCDACSHQRLKSAHVLWKYLFELRSQAWIHTNKITTVTRSTTLSYFSCIHMWKKEVERDLSRLLKASSGYLWKLVWEHEEGKATRAAEVYRLCSQSKL